MSKKALLILSIVAAILIVGMFLYRKITKQIGMDSQKIEEDIGSDIVKNISAEPVPQELVDYEISELGIKFKIRKDLKDDLIYHYSSDDDSQSVGFSLETLKDAGAECNPEKGPLGYLSKLKGNMADYDQYIQARTLKQFPGFITVFNGPQAPCSDIVDMDAVMVKAVNADSFGTLGRIKVSIELIKDDQASEKVKNTEEVNVDSKKSFSNRWKKYINKELGVTFEYPEKWGDIKEWREQGCFDYKNGGVDKSLITEEDQCFQIALQATNLENDPLFFSTQSPLRAENGAPRGGYWGDFTKKIKSEDDVKNFCNGKSNDLCSIFKTRNNLLVARNMEDRPFTELKVKMPVYYMKSTHPIYFSIIMSSERLEYKEADDDMKQIIDSLKFLQ